jgi:hypothetical protein
MCLIRGQLAAIAIQSRRIHNYIAFPVDYRFDFPILVDCGSVGNARDQDIAVGICQVSIDCVLRDKTGPNPYISHYLCMIGQICEGACLLFCRRGTSWRLGTRECLNDIWLRKSRSGLGGPGGDAAWVMRCGGVCQAGEARALAAAARRLAAQPQAWAAGHADAIATLMRRTLTRTRAPILSSLRRMVPQVALANGV